MLKVYAKDYFSLKYDAAAQNKITSLSGKNYIRDLTKQQQKKVVDKVKLLYEGTDVSIGDEVTLPYKVVAVPDPDRNGIDMLGDKIPLDVYPMHSKLGALFFGQEIDSYDNGVTTVPGQSILMGAFELLFTGLNLPNGVFPTVQCSYDLQHFTLGMLRPKGDSYPIYPTRIYDLKGVQNGAYATNNWEKIWVGGSLAETDVRDRVLSYTEDPQVSFQRRVVDLTLHNEYTLKTPNDVSLIGGSTSFPKVSFPLGGYSSYQNQGPRVIKYNLGFNEDIFSNIVRPFYTDEYLQGGYLDLYKQEISLVDRDTCRVVIQLPILNAYSINASESSIPIDTSGNRRFVRPAVTEWLKSVTVTLSYDQMSWSGVNFDRQVGEDSYPFKFQNTQVANADDTVRGSKWIDYYPKLIFDKYAEGKHYIELKVRVGFMLENDVTIDTPVQVYDLKNQVISRKGKPCTFRVKRIIKSFSNNEFYYIINCLED